MNSRAYRIYNQRTRNVKESINVIVDNHGNTSKRSLDEGDGLVQVPNSRQIATIGFDCSSLIEENNDFPSHSNVDSVVTPVEAPSVARFEAYNSEASDSQKTTECSTKWPDIANTAGSSIQKLGPPTHIYSQKPSVQFDNHRCSQWYYHSKKERRDYVKMVANVCYTSTMEPTTVAVALTDEHWLLAMQDELLQFERNQV